MRALRTIANLAWLNLLELLHDRSGIVTLIVMPLMLTYLFGVMMSGAERRVVVAFADADRTTYSRRVVAGLDAASYEVLRVSEDEARAMTTSGEAAGAVIVPEGFGDDLLGGVDTKVTLVKDPRSTSVQAVAESVSGMVERLASDAATIRIVRDEYRGSAAGGGFALSAPPPGDIFVYAEKQWSPRRPVSVKQMVVSAAKVRGAATQAAGFQQYSLGFTLMFMLFAAMGAAGGFLDERERGTLARLLTTPASKPTLVAGKVAGIYVTVLFEAIVMVGAGALLFRVPWGDDPLGVVMIIVTFGLAATGLGVMASTLARTRGQMSALTAVAATALSMLGGAYWPLDILNPTMRTVALLTPTGWAMTALTDVVVRYRGIGTAVVPSLVLLGMAVAFLAVGVSRLKLE